MKFGELFAKLAAKAGLDVANSKYADLFATQIEVPEDDALKIMGALMNLDDAKSNFQVQSHFYPAFAERLDKEMYDVANELGLPAEKKEELKKPEKTRERMRLFGGMIKEMLDESKKSRKGDEADKVEIKALQEKLVQQKKDFDEQNAVKEQQYSGERLRDRNDYMLASKDYENDRVTKDINVITARTVVDQELKEMGIVPVFADSKILPKQSKDVLLDWLSPTNERMSYEQIVDQILAKHKLLKVTDPDKKNQGGNDQQRTVISGGVVNPFNRTPDYNSVLDQQIREAEAVFQK